VLGVYGFERKTRPRAKAISGSSGETAMHAVEFFHEGDGLAEPMEQIRTWLDHERIQPSVFRLSLISGGTVFRVEFNARREAEAFARAFGGEVIRGGERAGTVAA
jgi:hypothetical protein